MRVQGYYFVKRKGTESWDVAQWLTDDDDPDTGFFWMTGMSREFYDEDFVQIGTRVSLPD